MTKTIWLATAALARLERPGNGANRPGPRRSDGGRARRG